MAYSETQKQDAVAIYLQHGLAEAHHRTGIGRGTLQRWLKAAGHNPADTAVHTVEQTRAAVEAHTAKMAADRVRLRAKILATAERMLDRMAETEVDYRGKDADRVIFEETTAVSCRAFATSAAILIDKFRLELGEATSVTAVIAPDRTPGQEEKLAKVINLRDVA